MEKKSSKLERPTRNLKPRALTLKASGDLKHYLTLNKSPARTLGRDAWTGTLVWVMVNPPDGVWEKGYVIEKRRTDTSLLYEFTIDLDSDGRIVNIKTLSVEKHNLEFEWVKRCDKELPKLAPQTPDMTSLSYLNEPEILETLKLRFFEKDIYTNTGPILIAMNPFENFPIYGDDTIEAYRNAGLKNKSNLKPHVFQIADRAYHKMFVEKFDADARENQVILVNGESGAGKTESTKHVLHYLAVVSSVVSASLRCESFSDDIEKQVVASNPIMESFGNSKTLRNNNSSRFGKFIELMYSAEGFIEGATIRTYLLETVRIVRQTQGERNYHVFYELDAGLSKEQKKAWGLTGLRNFRYTNQSGEYNRHDYCSDLDNYNCMRGAMSTLDIAEKDQIGVLKIVAGVMHMGNLTFTESTVTGEDAAKFSDESANHVNFVCDLLGVDKTGLTNAIGRRNVVIAGNNIQKTLTVEGAVYARDNFAKTIYDLLFKWIVAKINVALLGPSDETAASLIGVLDIFGFEYFKSNSFEQLCINYTNEKLQDHFNYSIFKSEQEVYQEEGLNWVFVEYPDNSARLDLLENKAYGIFSLVNEQLKLPKSSDEKLANAMYQKCSTHPFFSASRAEQVRFEFTVKHFACNVTYQTVGFVDKNRCEIAQELTDCMSFSSNHIIQAIVDPVSHSQTQGGANLSKARRSLRLPKGGGGGWDFDAKNSNSKVIPPPGAMIGRKTTTVASQLSHQLNELMLKIRSMRSHFIRCIKPNNELKRGLLDPSMVLSQLRCGGLLGAVKVFQAGFPNRISFQLFVARFSCFSLVSGVNALTRGLIFAIEDARTTALAQKYRFAAARLLEIVPLSEMVMNIVEQVEAPAEINIAAGMQMGRTNVFMRAPVFEYLGRLRMRISAMAAHRIQIFWKVRRFVKKSKVIRTPMGRTYAQLALRNFADYKRLQAIKRVCAAIMLQRRAKVFLCVRKRLKLLQANLIIQKYTRRFLAKLKVRRIKGTYLTKVQKAFRRYRLRKRYLRMRASAIIIQKIIRGFLGRRRRMRLKRGLDALVVLQSHVRKFIVLQKTKKNSESETRRLSVSYFFLWTIVCVQFHARRVLIFGSN